jgi:nitroreductase
MDMDFLELAESRYSVRSYQSRPVEQHKLDRILEAVRLAPSGSNRQPWRFVVVRDAEVRGRLAAACANQRFIAQAPVVIAGVGLLPDRVMQCGVPGDPVDLAIALEHLALAATVEGLGTCWIGAFDQDRVRDALEIPESAKVIGVMTLGYSADGPRPKRRKPLDEIVCYERWPRTPPADSA